MQPYLDFLHGERPEFDDQHLKDLALLQLCAIVLALAVLSLLGG